MFENKTVVGLGFFDGLHIGHLDLLERVTEFARKNNLESVIYSFDSHPNIVLKKIQYSKLLINNKQKSEIINAAGINTLYFDNFNESLAKMSPRQFVEEVLVKQLNVSHVVAGFNYNFGANGKGNTDELIRFGSEYGFTVEIVPPVYFEGEIVSSTLIRRLIEEGNVARVSQLLGRPFEIRGVVKTGQQLGSKMKFATANVFSEQDLITPLCGVYATIVDIDGDGKNYHGVTNVGTNPTVTTGQTTIVETHILDFNKDIYGKEITIKFIELIRVEEKFSNVEELFSQIAKDSEIARKILNDA